MAFRRRMSRSAQDWSIDDLLVRGGEDRIVLDPATGLNRYGCGARPDPRAAAFGSATCSTISDGARADLAALADRLRARGPAAEICSVEASRIRDELGALCGLPAGGEVILAASGTDLHLIVADLVRGGSRQPVTSVLPDPAETGRGVPSALSGRRFGSSTPFGGPCRQGETPAAMIEGRVATVPVREADGGMRPPEAVDRDFEAACARAITTGGKVLLTLVDVSKTGIVAPSLGCAIHLKARFGQALDVLVDACQFRLSPQSLAAYLDAGFLVAVTGSKFVTGPPFSGALLVPPTMGEWLRGQPVSLGLGDYSCRQDWPQDWSARAVLPALPNPGLLFRWEAALHELRAFRALPGERVAGFLRDFAGAVERRLDAEPGLERLPTPALCRRDAEAWDAVPTIFPFLLSGARLVEDVFRELKAGVAGRAIHLGQPVAVGVRDGRPLAALRVCASARLVVEALGPAGRGEAVIQRACDAISATAACAGSPGPGLRPSS
jgi:hypothetical protein